MRGDAGSPENADTVRLDIVADDARSRIEGAAGLVEELRRYDADYHAELDWWITPFELSDGVPDMVLPSVTEAGRVGVNRAFPHPAHAVRRETVGQDRSAILVLSTPEDAKASSSFARGPGLR